MFNLEEAISQWRWQMLANGIKSPVPLEELESHLRDEVETQARSGIGMRKAFAIAAERMGQANELKNEFKKTERKFMKKTLSFLAGFLGVAIGAAFILPAAAWYHHHDAMSLENFGSLMIGVAIVAAGVGVAIYGLKKAKA